MASTRGQDQVGDESAGFTLVELLVTILIIGILAAIAIPMLLHQKDKGYRAAVTSDLRNVRTAEEAYAAAHGSAYTDDLAALGAVGFHVSAGVVPALALVDPSTPAAGFCISASNTHLTSGPGSSAAPLWATNQGADSGSIFTPTDSQPSPDGCP